MLYRHGRSARAHARRRAVLAGAAVLSVALAGCTAAADSDGPAAAGSPSAGQSESAASPEAPAVSVASISDNLPAGEAGVPVDQQVKLTADQGTFQSVEVTFGAKKEKLAGELSEGDRVWTSTDRLEPGLLYTVRSVAVDADGLTKRDKTSFRTEDLSLDQQTYPSIAPLGGETVGVGMPVIVRFDVPVTDRASIEKHLSVSSSPAQVGAWHWISDNEVHWRPKTYWKPGTDVRVTADINSIPAGNGIYGQLSRSTSFHVGDAMVSKIDVAAHQMRVFRNGELLRTIPISAGKPGFTTRSGTKVIIEKFRSKRMDAATTGISPDNPEYYNLSNVEYAMRVTYSGEFLHAAPWSVGSQGNANVSHGCVGMSTADAGWLFNLTKRGDVVEVTGTDREMTLTNGYGDWNETFQEYRQGSALS
ncbi:L,D-transpeptidase [Nocardioides mesophilus]|uniref:L,D-transpeptidase n=1 Tax=Nocardioides mesophilus TaxID=433659 RepID=A0A7G9RC61_9ACTN|nr:L,D-transpeptidase [Nocardioides mesophilus]